MAAIGCRYSRTKGTLAHKTLDSVSGYVLPYSATIALPIMSHECLDLRAGPDGTIDTCRYILNTRSACLLPHNRGVPRCRSEDPAAEM